MSGKQKIYFGGWYQRTTLHLSEIYNLFAFGESSLDLNKEKLKKLQAGMDLSEVSREVGSLEFVKGKTKEGVVFSYYEDGLYVLETDEEDIEVGKKRLEDYYEKSFAPAVAYIFSLGAPTPKELASIKTVHPVAVGAVSASPEKYEVDEEKYGQIYSRIASKEVMVLKTPKFLFLVASPKNGGVLEGLVEMQIFFREFKDQLQKYLDIHRKVWEEISDIKERKVVVGREVAGMRLMLDNYQKTINLINSRINQMGAYVHTRATMAKEANLEDHLSSLFQYKFDVLNNTHGYIKEIWAMTGNYLSNAIQVLREIQDQSTDKNIQSLRLITTYGVVGGVIGYLSRDSLPTVTQKGVVYFLVLIVATGLINWLVSFGYKRSRYKVVLGETAKF